MRNRICKAKIAHEEAYIASIEMFMYIGKY